MPVKRMIKIKRNNLILFAFFVITLIALNSCSKPECKTSADCASRLCTLSTCESGKCSYTLEKNCCGNRINDTIENGKPGSQCTCPQDYGKCEGKGKIKIGSRTEDATYLHRYCNADYQCVLGVEKKDVVPQNFLDSINLGFFKASSVIKYNKPFDVARDSFEFIITLDDAGKDFVLPMRLTKVKLLLSVENSRAELLIAEKDLDSVLNGVGDESTIIVPLNLNYKPETLEETGGLRYVIDYTYKRQVLSGKTVNGTNLFTNETARTTFTSPSKPVFFVRSE